MKYKISVLIEESGTFRHVYPKGSAFSLNELQKFVGGMVELIKLPDGMQMWCNENGLALGKEKNIPATEIVQKYYGNEMGIIVGDVLYCHESLTK